MTEPAERGLVERAADDLLLLFARVESPDIALPTADDALASLSAAATASMPAVAQYVKRNRTQAKGAQFGYELAVDALLKPASAHLLLSMRLLAWTSKRTGLTHAEVVAEVLAQTDVDPEG